MATSLFITALNMLSGQHLLLCHCPLAWSSGSWFQARPRSKELCKAPGCVEDRAMKATMGLIRSACPC